MKKRTVVLIVVLLLLVLAVVFRGVGRKGEARRQAKDAAGDVRYVEVQTVRLTEFVDSIEVAGVLEPRRQVAVSAEVSGRVEQVFYDLGDAVKKGAVLCRIEAEPYEIALAQANANLLTAQSAYEQAESSFKRAKGLKEKGLISESEWERAESAYLSAKGALEAATAQKRLAERNLKNTRVRAPIGGAIASRSVEVGELVGPQKPLFVIADTSKLVLKAGLAEDSVARVDVGFKARVVLDSTGDEFEGVLARMGATADRQGMFPIEIEVASGNGLNRRAGFKARAFIETERYSGVVLLPQTALVKKDDGTYVFVADGDTARMRKVEVALVRGEQAVVTSGLTDGEEVIVAGASNLEDGSAIKRVGER